MKDNKWIKAAEALSALGDSPPSDVLALLRVTNVFAEYIVWRLQHDASSGRAEAICSFGELVVADKSAFQQVFFKQDDPVAYIEKLLKICSVFQRQAKGISFLKERVPDAVTEDLNLLKRLGLLDDENTGLHQRNAYFLTNEGGKMKAMYLRRAT